MKIKYTIECDWDWSLFSTPSIEISNMCGYWYLMIRFTWFWGAIEFRKEND